MGNGGLFQVDAYILWVRLSDSVTCPTMTPLPPILDQAVKLAGQSQIYLGTSSWKYEGWQGLVYDDHYPSKKAFQQRCLAEYARHFPAVGIDSTFYQYPGERLMAELDALTPGHFRFGLKATEEITVHTYPNHPRYGQRKGHKNPHFLNGELFARQFVEVVDQLGAKLGPIILQFGALPDMIVADGSFLRQLDDFLAGLPEGYRYATEIRNPQLFADGYFEVLRRHGVAHVHTSWSWMPSLGDQLAQARSFTADFFVMRLLTPSQVAHRDAVENFFPYSRVQSPLPELRQALVGQLKEALQKSFPGFVFINNRLEGAAPLTIAHVLAQLLGETGQP